MKEASMNSLFRFIKTFVIHLTAKRVLEKYAFATKDQEVDITLFTVDRSSLCIPAGSWQKMEDILRASFLSHPSSTPGDTDAATKATETLRKKIHSPPSNCGAKSRVLLANFGNIVQGNRVVFNGGMHCETVLATLKKFHELSITAENGNAKFISTCKVLSFTYLAARSHHLS
jgi:hypothetical protein